MKHCKFSKVPGVTTAMYGVTSHHLMYGQDNIYINSDNGNTDFTVYIRKGGHSINYIKNVMKAKLHWIAIELQET